MLQHCHGYRGELEAGACAADWAKGGPGLRRALRQQRSPDVGQRTTRNERIPKVIG